MLLERARGEPISPNARSQWRSFLFFFLLFPRTILTADSRAKTVSIADIHKIGDSEHYRLDEFGIFFTVYWELLFYLFSLSLFLRSVSLSSSNPLILKSLEICLPFCRDKSCGFARPRVSNAIAFCLTLFKNSSRVATRSILRRRLIFSARISFPINWSYFVAYF